VTSAYCLLCDWPATDREFDRVEVWRDHLWRVTTSLVAPVPGFSYLEPRRHIPHFTDLDSEEAATLGARLAWVTGVLREATAADLVYVNVFGERVAHLHFNLAPHRAGDALQGGRAMIAPDASPVPRPELQDVSERLRQALNAANWRG
jgi:diadenosine tetraphosphate (Ap4A) HIT family hydrolase